MYKDFNNYLKIEAIALIILSVVLLDSINEPLWLLPVTFLVFDISMIGYAKNKTVGALSYNLVHNTALPSIVIAFGLIISSQLIATIGCCWLFHVAVDRSIGYGLKDKSSFNNTHLGNIKKQK